MGYLIIVRGAAGVGKSTVSRMLAKRIRADVVYFEKIMKSYGLDFIPGDKWIPLEKFLKAHDKIVPELREKLRGTNLVIDHNFYHRDQIEDLIEKVNCKHFIFTLKAELVECIKRDKTRKDDLGEEAVRDVFKLVSEFDYVGLDGE